MFILDTNVLSELMRSKPDAVVVNWVGTQPSTSLFTTAITQAEILYGVALLPEGKRKEGLAHAVDQMFLEDFRDRILSFDSICAHAFSHIAARRREMGRPISQFDAQIAAIAHSRKAVLATRNVSDFEDCDIEIVNPWMAGA